VTNVGLLADAAGVGSFILLEVPEAFRAFGLDTETTDEARTGRLSVLPGRIGLLLLELPHE
jgi:hypothetical protein